MNHDPQSTGTDRSPFPEITPEITPDVERRRALRAGLAEVARPLIDPHTGLLAQALATSRVPAHYGGNDLVALLRWAIFNPFGPTMMSVDLLPTSGEREYLVSVLQHHPIEDDFAVVGLVPGEVATDGRAMQRLIGRLIAENGVPGWELWSGALPTHVMTRGCAFGGDALRELILGLVRGVDRLTVLETIRDLREHWLDPLGRTEAQIERVLGEMPKNRARHEARATRERRLAERALLDEWFDLASDPAHVESEMAAMDTAWQHGLALARQVHAAGGDVSGPGPDNAVPPAEA